MYDERSMTIDASEAADLQWRKSRACMQGQCVEVAPLGADAIAVRNSTRPMVDPIVFDTAEFADFVAGVKAGDFDDLLDHHPRVGDA